MFKKILTFSAAFVLCACATAPIKQLPTQVREHKRVDFFAGGHQQAAFKVVGQLSDAYLEGVLLIKKIGDSEFDVQVLTGGTYRALQATVTPVGTAYKYLFPDVDKLLVRGRIEQFLNLLLLEPGDYKSYSSAKTQLTITYKGKDATVRLLYAPEAVYPFAAKTITLLNTADLTYAEYAPSTTKESVQVPHQLVYKDGNITLDMQLISLR